MKIFHYIHKNTNIIFKPILLEIESLYRKSNNNENPGTHCTVDVEQNTTKGTNNIYTVLLEIYKYFYA